MENLDREFIQELSRGNVSLWISSSVEFSDYEDSLYAEMPWTAIWSESKSPEWGVQLESFRKESKNGLPPAIVVPRRLDDELGTKYTLAQYTPVFYIKGFGNTWDALPARETRRARDEKIDEISKLQKGIVYFLGFDDPLDLAKLIIDEIPHHETDVRFVFSSDDENYIEIVAATVGDLDTNLFKKLGVLNSDFRAVLSTVKSSFVEDTHRAAIFVGETAQPVSIEKLLRRENPIDQSFYVLLSSDVEADSDESNSDVLEHFLAGRTDPWAAINRKVLWDRFQTYSADDHPIKSAMRLLKGRSNPNAPTVVSFSIAAESGSGLTTLLQQIGHEAATRGYPTLIHRSQTDSYDYDTLRNFLEGVQRGEDGLLRAALIVIDETAQTSVPLWVAELPNRLTRDGRPAVVVRGLRSERNAKLTELQCDKKLPTIVASKVKEAWWPHVLRDVLDKEAQNSLVEWVKEFWGDGRELESISDALRHWKFLDVDSADIDTDPENIRDVPFLVCLYLILKEHIVGQATIGRHLINKVKHEFEALRAQEQQPSSSATVLRRDQLELAVSMIKESFESRPYSESSRKLAPPSPEVLLNTFLALSAFSVMRIYPPASVLASFVGETENEIDKAIEKLKSLDLVKKYQDSADHHSGMSGRSAFYIDPETIGFRHPVYGALILDALPTSGDWIMSDFIDEILEAYDSNEKYSVEILGCIFRKMPPKNSHIRFVELICRKLLRYQKVPGSPYHEWLNDDYGKSKCDRLIDVLDAVPEVVADQSASILHTRGLTRYKSCRPGIPIGICRTRYEKASNDLQTAFDRTMIGEDDSDNPASIITTQGNLYHRWSWLESNSEGGDLSNAEKYQAEAIDLLKNGLELHSGNSFAAGALAGILLDRCEEFATNGNIGKFAEDIGSVFEYLQFTPNPAYFSQWEDNYNRAMKAVGHDNDCARQAIRYLKDNNQDLWRALEALKVLKGIIPQEISEQPADISQYRRALKILNLSANPSDEPSYLSDLIRYAVFSADKQNRRSYGRRYELISRIDESKLVRTPVFLFDFAMLSFQTGNYGRAIELFRLLRRGRRFIDVPMERAEILVEPENAEKRMLTRIKVTEISEGRAWANVEEPVKLRMHVPLSLREFSDSGGVRPTLGSVLPANIIIRSAGPIAVPVTA